MLIDDTPIVGTVMLQTQLRLTPLHAKTIVDQVPRGAVDYAAAQHPPASASPSPTPKLYAALAMSGQFPATKKGHRAVAFCNKTVRY